VTCSVSGSANAPASTRRRERTIGSCRSSRRQRVERQTEGLERERPKERGIAGLAKNHVGTSDELSVTEHCNALLAHDLVAVGQAELLLEQRFDLQFVQNRGRHD